MVSGPGTDIKSSNRIPRDVEVDVMFGSADCMLFFVSFMSLLLLKSHTIVLKFA